MKGLMRWVVPVVCATGLAACATTGNGSSYAAANAGSTQQKFVTDSTYVAKVEKMASRSGVRVNWVNPPVKRVDRD